MGLAIGVVVMLVIHDWLYLPGLLLLPLVLVPRGTLLLAEDGCCGEASEEAGVALAEVAEAAEKGVAAVVLTRGEPSGSRSAGTRATVLAAAAPTRALIDATLGSGAVAAPSTLSAQLDVTAPFSSLRGVKRAVSWPSSEDNASVLAESCCCSGSSNSLKGSPSFSAYRGR